MLKPCQYLLIPCLLFAIASCDPDEAKINAIKARIIQAEDDSGRLVRQNHLEERAVAVIKISIDSLDRIDQALKDSTRTVYRLSPFASEYLYGKHNDPPITLKDLIELDSGSIRRPLLKAAFQYGYALCCQFIADTVAKHYQRLDSLKKISDDQHLSLERRVTDHKNKMTDNDDKLDSIGRNISRDRQELQDLK